MRRFRPLPSAFITHTSLRPSARLSQTVAIFSPFDDQEGLVSDHESFERVSFANRPSVTFFTKISLVFARGRQKATLEPSDDHEGS